MHSVYTKRHWEDRSGMNSGRPDRSRNAVRCRRVNWAVLAVAVWPMVHGPCAVAAATTDTWSDGSSDWNTAANWSLGVIPGAGNNVSIVDSDGVSRTITYDYNGPAVTLGTLNLSLTGGTGSASESLSMAGFTLAAVDENVGGYFGSTAGGVGVVTQSGGTNTVGMSGTNMVGTGGLNLGYNSSDIGAYSLSGSGYLSAGNDENIGYSGAGIFNQTGGTNSLVNLTAFDSLNIAYGAGSTGAYLLSGGLLLTNNGENVGNGGVGSFNQTGGTNSFGYNLALGVNAGSSGSYVLSGANSYMSGVFESVGVSGAGNFTQLGGSNNIQYLFLGGNSVGVASGTSGTYDLEGGSLTVGTICYDQGSNFTQTGGSLSYGTLSQTGGILTAAAAGGLIQNPVVLSGSTTPQSYHLSGGTLVSASITVSAGGSFLIYGGAIDCSVLTLDGGLVSFPSIVLDSGSPVAAFGIPAGASTTVLNFISGTLGAVNEYLGTQAGTFGFSQPNSLTYAPTSLFVAFVSNSTATYTMSTGTMISSLAEYIGYSGEGSFNQTGGVNMAAGDSAFVVASNSGSRGAYALSGNANLVVAGLEEIGLSGTGCFMQSGGMNQDGQILTLGVYAGSGGAYLLSGGTLSVTQRESVGGMGAGAFSQTGGLNVLGSFGFLVVNGAYALGGSGAVVTPEETINGNLVQTGGTNTVYGTTYVNGLYVGGTYLLINGSLSANATNEVIGSNNGATFFNQTGGTNSISGGQTLWIGNVGSTGGYILGGSSAVLLGKNEILGSELGTGNFIQTGGTNIASTLQLGVFDSQGVGNYCLTGGTLSDSGRLTMYFGSMFTIGDVIATVGLVPDNKGDIRLVDENGTAGDLSVTGGFSQAFPGELDIAIGGLFAGSQYSVLERFAISYSVAAIGVEAAAVVGSDARHAARHGVAQFVERALGGRTQCLLHFAPHRLDRVVVRAVRRQVL